MVRKAIIPVAGKGTRLMPVTGVIPKAMFPLVNAEGQIRSVLHVICDQAISADIEQIAVIVSPWQKQTIQKYFEIVQEEGFGKLSAHIEYIIQQNPAGFGDAVMQAVDFVSDEPFMLLLGDHICLEEKGWQKCTIQVKKAFNDISPEAMIGVQLVSAEEISRVGVCGGEHIKQNIYRCSDFVEKPDLKTAQKKLVTKQLPEDTFLAHCGIYIFTPEIFDCLAQVAKNVKNSGKEIELADAQSLLLKKYPEKYLLCKIEGKAYDIGTPSGYVNTQMAFIRHEKI